ncbi:MAG TPA: GntR family transcriptional regulator [Candidatus Lumbricidophila sp.]|nr:GntR family transcriptional regulator [Candidatus Lumbricidophila sp.]
MNVGPVRPNGNHLARSATAPALAAGRRPKRLSTNVADTLIERIVSGSYVVGSQLPPEPALVEEFEVSRPVIREAVKLLEAAHLVTIRQGDGTVICERSRWSMLDPRVLKVAVAYDLGDRLTNDATELRVELEGALVAEAAPKLTDSDFSVMLVSLRMMDSSSDPNELQAADIAFHGTYRQRSGNELKSSIVRFLVDEMPPPAFAAADLRAMYDIANRQHWDLYHALREGRTADAVDAIARHVRQNWTYRVANEPAGPALSPPT